MLILILAGAALTWWVAGGQLPDTLDALRARLADLLGPGGR